MKSAKMIRKKDQVDVNQLWIDYKTAPTKALRDKLLVQYMPLVQYVAQKVGSTLPRNVDRDDLVSYGVFGLFDAIEKFDLERGYKFETYAMLRIRGAVLDELRGADWVPRSVRFYKKSYDDTREMLRYKLNREPKEQEIMDEMGVDANQERTMNVKMSFSRPFEPLGTYETAGTANDVVYYPEIASNEPDVETAMETDQLHSRVSDVITGLPERERFVITLCYYDGLTLGEIGLILGVTESRVCQIHTRAISKMLTELD